MAEPGTLFALRLKSALTDSLLAAIIAAKLMSDIDKNLLLESRVKQRFANLETALTLAASREGFGEE